MNKCVVTIVSFLALGFMLAYSSGIRSAKASFETSNTITIKADGSVKPAAAPISHPDNITYTLTDDIVYTGGQSGVETHAIEILRNNVILDGANHILDGVAITYKTIGIYLQGDNVTVKNFNIRNFVAGITLDSFAEAALILGNTITENTSIGIELVGCSNNNITGNTIENTGAGIWIGGAVSNFIVTNNIIHNHNGMELYYTPSNNVIYHNNFIDNYDKQVYIYTDTANTWDNGPLSGGNYWSDYIGTDTNNDGIGETYYSVGPGPNIDHYPLMNQHPIHDDNITGSRCLQEKTSKVAQCTRFRQFLFSKSVSCLEILFFFFSQNLEAARYVLSSIHGCT
jgi:parallel beta-helix repeat protein